MRCGVELLRWRWIVASLAALAVASGCADGAQSVSGEAGEPRSAGEAAGGRDGERRRRAPRGGTADRIASVTDGDTVVLAGLGKSRLIGIDTPEVYGGRECYGREASAYAERLLPPGTAVRYRFDVERRDRYGRALIYLWAGPRFVNGELVRGGYAVPLTIPPNVRYADRFVALARSARSRERGLWSPSTCAGEPVGAVSDSPPGRDRAAPGCDPNYAGACLKPGAHDYDCDGGEGDGPEYTGPVRVVGEDPFDLDTNGDGTACDDF